METIVEKAGETSIEKAATFLREGRLVAFPTETVYGLGANGLDEEAAKRIYEAKGRPSDNPLILHVSSMKEVEPLVEEIPEQAYKLAESFWPGPMTMVLRKSAIVPYGTTGGLDTVAIRMPDHPVALEMIAKANVPVAAPSANTSGRPSPTLASHVEEDLAGKIDMILDGGAVGIGIESTIIDLSGDVPMILRPGAITPSMLREVLGVPVEFDPAITGMAPDQKPKAPGMKYTHYAPKGILSVVEGKQDAVIGTINELVRQKKANGFTTGVLATQETKEAYEADVVLAVGTRTDEATVSAGLYAMLREFDRLGTEYMYSESFAGDEFGGAIMNRLLKSAGHRIITASDEK